MHSKYLRGLSFSVEAGELFDVQLTITVLIETLEQEDDFGRRKIEGRPLEYRRSLLQSYVSISVDVIFLELGHQLHFPT
jgi:hypothetical protein